MRVEYQPILDKEDEEVTDIRGGTSKMLMGEVQDIREQLKLIESIEKKQLFRIRSCSDVLRLVNCKCMLAICMLALFAVVAQAVFTAFFHSPSSSPSSPSTYDFIVVGAGPAGCVVTRKLVDAGATVLLLEAGGSTQYELGGSDHFAGPVTRFDIPFLWPGLNHFLSLRWPEVPALLGRGVGGSGVMNAMIYVRALPSDVLNWGVPGWNWDTFLKTYKSLETYELNSESTEIDVPDYHGKSGPVCTSRPKYVDPISPEFVSSAVGTGMPLLQDFNDPARPREGVGYYHFNIRGGQRDSAARTMLKPILESKNHKFLLSLNSTVTRVLFTPQNADVIRVDKRVNGMRATGVEYVQNGITKTAKLRARTTDKSLDPFPAGCVILSAGAILTPKLLLLSGIGPEADLHKWNVDVVSEVEGTGWNLQDHPAIGLSYTVDPALFAMLPSMWSINSELVSYISAVEAFGSKCSAILSNSSSSKDEAPAREMKVKSEEETPLEFGILGSAGLCAGAFLKTPYSDPNLEAPDIQLTLFPAVTEPHLTSREWTTNATPRAVLLESNQILITVALLTPEARYRVILGGADWTDPPVIERTTELSESDIAKLIWGIGKVREIISTPPLSLLTRSEVSASASVSGDEALNLWVKNNVYPNSHWAGSARMGSSDCEHCVVDEKLKVRGVDGLRVVDASVIPIIPNGNVHSTVTAVASIAADIILGDKT